MNFVENGFRKVAMGPSTAQIGLNLAALASIIGIGVAAATRPERVIGDTKITPEDGLPPLEADLVEYGPVFFGRRKFRNEQIDPQHYEGQSKGISDTALKAMILGASAGAHEIRTKNPMWGEVLQNPDDFIQSPADNYSAPETSWV